MNFEEPSSINFFIKEEELNITSEDGDHKHNRCTTNLIDYDTENCCNDFSSSTCIRIKNEEHDDKSFFDLPSNNIDHINICNYNITNFDQFQEDSCTTTTIPIINDDHHNNDNELNNSISTICGEIELSNGVFVLICKFCTKKFLSLKSFMSHTLNIHLPPIINWSNDDDIPNNHNIREELDHNNDDEEIDTKIINNEIIKPINNNEQDNNRYEQNEKEYLIKKIIQGEIKDIKLRLFKKSDKKYYCPVCNYSSLVPNFLQSHFKVHFICEQSNHFRCNYCNAVFARKSIYNTHVKTHTHPYKCCFCPFEFTTEDKLKEHQRYHLSETKLKCDYCNKCFLLPGELNKHLKLSHSITKIIPTSTTPITTKPLWKCIKCGRNFKKKISLELHNFNTQNNCTTNLK